MQNLTGGRYGLSFFFSLSENDDVTWGRSGREVTSHLCSVSNRFPANRVLSRLSSESIRHQEWNSSLDPLTSLNWWCNVWKRACWEMTATWLHPRQSKCKNNTLTHQPALHGVTSLPVAMHDKCLISALKNDCRKYLIFLPFHHFCQS